MIAIAAVGSHIPAASLRVAELPELSELDETARTTFLGLGIETISADDGLSAPDLAAVSAKEALAEAGIPPADVHALVLVESRVPEAFMASEATRVQDAIGAQRALAFSVGGLGCVSITPALLASRGLLAADPELGHVLVAHGSKPPAPRRYRHPVTISGDGGGAIVVARDGPIRVIDLDLETNGAYWDLYRVDYRDRPAAHWAEACSDIPTYSFRLALESRNRFAAMNERLLARNGLTARDVAHVVMQNLSEGAFRFYEEAFGLRIAAACRENLRRHGHLGPLDVILNLRTGIDSGEFTARDRVLVMNASPVAAWSSMLVEIGEGARADSFLL